MNVKGVSSVVFVCNSRDQTEYAGSKPSTPGTPGAPGAPVAHWDQKECIIIH